MSSFFSGHQMNSSKLGPQTFPFACDIPDSQLLISLLINLLMIDLLCLTPLSTIDQLYIGVQLYSWWRPEEIIDLSQVTSKLKLYDIEIAMSGIELTTLAISYIDFIGRGKSNYLTIMERHPTYVTTICKNRIINISPFNTNTLNVCICV